MSEYKIGYGEDIHRLVCGRPLILGGIEIPFEKGEEAHSDGDVLVHALIDAILGAMAIGDIGKLYPDTSEKTLNMNSMTMLKEVFELVIKNGYQINNVDTTIILEKPKLQEYIPLMRKNIANTLDLDIDNVSIKAKTNEGLGPIGEGRAIKAVCVALLTKK